MLSPSVIAKGWVRFYFVLEIIWFLFWATLMFAFKFGVNTRGSIYWLGNELAAFHLALMPSVAYGLDDGNKFVVVLYLAVIITDLSRMLEIALHTEEPARSIEWAWGTSLALAAYGVFIGVVALTWFLYVWINNVRFKRAKSTASDDFFKK